MSDEKYQNFDKVYSHFYEKNDNVAVLAKNIMKMIKKSTQKKTKSVIKCLSSMPVLGLSIHRIYLYKYIFIL